MEIESVKLFLKKIVYVDVQGYNDKIFSYRGTVKKVENDGSVLLQKSSGEFVSFKADKVDKMATLEESR